MVTHSSTSRPVQCLCMAERTGCPVFTDLWSYVKISLATRYMFSCSWESLDLADVGGSVTSCSLHNNGSLASGKTILPMLTFEWLSNNPGLGFTDLQNLPISTCENMCR